MLLWLVAIPSHAVCSLDRAADMADLAFLATAEGSPSAMETLATCYEEAGLTHAALVLWLGLVDGPDRGAALDHVFALGARLGDVATLAPWAERIPPAHEPSGPGAAALRLAWARSMIAGGHPGDAVLLLDEGNKAEFWPIAQDWTRGEAELALGRRDRALAAWASIDIDAATDPTERTVGIASRFQAAEAALDDGDLAGSVRWLRDVPRDSAWWGEANATIAEMGMVIEDDALVAEGLRRLRVGPAAFAPGGRVTRGAWLSQRCAARRATHQLERALREIEPLGTLLDGLTSGRGARAPAAASAEAAVVAIQALSDEDWSSRQVVAHRDAVARETAAALGARGGLWPDAVRDLLAPMYAASAAGFEELLQDRGVRAVAQADRRVDIERARAMDLLEALRTGQAGVSCGRGGE